MKALLTRARTPRLGGPLPSHNHRIFDLSEILIYNTGGCPDAASHSARTDGRNRAVRRTVFWSNLHRLHVRTWTTQWPREFESRPDWGAKSHKISNLQDALDCGQEQSALLSVAEILRK